MEFDDERFLTLVFQYPCIYDNHDPNYKNGDSREICWADIGNEMHCNGKGLIKNNICGVFKIVPVFLWAV